MVAIHREKMIIYGAETSLGREIACLGRSLGHEMIGVVPTIPALTEPWMHGVRWVEDSPAQAHSLLKLEAPPTILIYCATTLFDSPAQTFSEILLERPLYLLKAAQSLARPPRFIYRSTASQPLLPCAFTEGSRQFEAHLKGSKLSFAILRFPLLYGPSRPDSVAALLLMRALSLARILPSSQALRIETAALAALRVALETERSGIIEPQEIGLLGDIMLAQSSRS